MYVSTIGLLKHHLISDGFDNIIRVFSLERSFGAHFGRNSYRLCRYLYMFHVIEGV